MAPAQTLRRQGHEVNAFVLNAFAYYATRVAGVGKVYRVDHKERRGRDAPLDTTRWAYLRHGGKHDRYIDLFCPGWRHEAKSEGRPTLDRTDCFFEACGLPLSKARAPFIPVSLEERGFGRGYMRAHGMDVNRPVVGIQLGSLCQCRTWGVKQCQRLAGLLAKAGVSTVLYSYNEKLPKACGGPTVLHRVSHDILVATVSALDAMVCVDSGLLHLASAVTVPTVALFGNTIGHLICKHYPLAMVLQGRAPGRHPECRPPCNYQWRKGWKPELCREGGCPSTNSVTVEAVLEATLLQISMTRGQRRG